MWICNVNVIFWVFDLWFLAVRKTCPHRKVKCYFEISYFVELSGNFLGKRFVFSWIFLMKLSFLNTSAT